MVLSWFRLSSCASGSRFLAPALRAFACIFALYLSTGCIGSMGPVVAHPAAEGDAAVGVTTITVEDPTRNRRLTVEVWYPAAPPAATGDAPVVYDVEAMGGTVARLRSPTRAHRDVAPRAGGPYPVVLVSHGTGSTRFGNLTLCETLASHGYIVAAPDHKGDTVDDALFGISFDQRARNTFNRPLDLSRVLDDLEARSGDSQSLFSGLIDMKRVAVAGHSFGSSTALAIAGARFNAPRQEKECEKNNADRRCRVLPVLGPAPYRYRDPRVKALVLISPAGFDLYRDDGVAAVDAPVLVVGNALDQTDKFDEYAKPTYDALEGPRYLLRLDKSGHLTPTDVCQVIDSIGLLAKTFGGKKASDGCGGSAAGFISNRRANELLARATLAFLDRQLNDNRMADHELQEALSPTMAPDSSVKEVAQIVAK